MTGDAKSGKSWVAGLLCEQLILHGYSVCAIDPEGDYSSLEGLPGVTVLGREDAPPTPRELLRALRYPDRSVVIDLSRLPHDEKLHYVRAVLAGAERPQAPDRASASHPARRSALLPARRRRTATSRLRAQWLYGRRRPARRGCLTALLDSTEVMIVTCESNPAEVEALRARCAGCAGIDAPRWEILSHSRSARQSRYRSPKRPAESCDCSRLPRASRRTSGIVEKYVDVPVSSHLAFVFNANGQPAHRIRTLRQFVSELENTPPALLAPVHRAWRFLALDWRCLRRSCAGRRAAERSNSEVEPDRARRRTGNGQRRAWPIRPG